MAITLQLIEEAKKVYEKMEEDFMERKNGKTKTH